MKLGSGDGDVIRVHDDPSRIDPCAWDALLQAQPRPTPFMRHAYLHALHTSGSAVARTGWTPRFVTLHRGRDLVGAVPAYLKSHSWGEYVFDWAWADAYRRHGLAYYPKLVAAVPFTPVPGSRLLARDVATRRQLLRALLNLATDQRASSAHLLFADESDETAIDGSGWMLRRGVQFHWVRDETDRPRDFAAFLATLRHDKRKKIQQEQRRVAAAGVTFTVHEGDAIASTLWDFFYHCYCLTYAAHASTPYLTRGFFAAMAERMAEHREMIVARRAGSPDAASLVAIDRGRGEAYGRYWGCVEPVPCLHFDACYYQPLAWAIENGLRRFEGGAQGEHKVARGLLPVATRSAHWLANRQFARAVDDYLRAERAGIVEYVDELREHSPFKTPAARD